MVIFERRDYSGMWSFLIEKREQYWNSADQDFGIRTVIKVYGHSDYPHSTAAKLALFDKFEELKALHG